MPAARVGSTALLEPIGERRKAGGGGGDDGDVDDEEEEHGRGVSKLRKVGEGGKWMRW